MVAGERKHRNRLADSTSPYLLQHAHNPVDWFPWGDEALARARDEDKPILLSIGYSACHWCHVMAHESFEDEAIGAQMSRDFVCIKVDREERPDLDDIYMAATLAMNHGQGGWPMTVFLTPEQQPFFAGTYFPPEDRWGRPGFRTLLNRIVQSWREEREALRDQGSRIVELLAQNARAAPSLSVGESEVRAAVAQLERAFDPRWGGFGPSPKFPPSAAISLLLRAHRRFGLERALEMARGTLDAMARGGMYDQLGGGFHRYSVDERWLVPHFEKMLYDNALLAKAYLAGSAAAAEPFYARIAAEILDYVLREMTDSHGGFYSATDADSEGVEGRFFVWTPDQVRAELGDEAASHFCAWYDVSERGNWEGHSILNTPRPEQRVAEELGLSAEELRRSLEASRRALYEVRKRRVPPGLDDKVLTAWNGLMIGAMAEGARVLGEPRYLAAAERAADFALATLRSQSGRLLRTWRAGRAHLDGYLEDYAYLAEGLVDLYEAGASQRYLDAALALIERLRSEFRAPDGGFYSVSGDHEQLVVRHREGHDGATPSANAVAAQVLARLGFHHAREDLREDAARAIRAYGKAIAQQPRAFARSLEVVDLLLEGPVELAFVGAPGSAELAALRRETARRYLPNRIIAHGEPGSAHPLLEGRPLVGGRPALYVCRDFACRRPVTEPAEVAELLDADRQALRPASALTPPRLAGSGTVGGTARLAERHRGAHPHGYGPLGASGLTTSRLGFGGYRIDDETGEHREALVGALRAGVNLIDTSSNYAHGASERLVGEVLGELARGDGPARDELIVVSKIGYIQGPNMELARARAEPFPEVVRYDDQLWHCIHPEFLADQLERSLERLRLDTLDVLLLHNPEYFLAEAARSGERSIEERRDEYYRRLTEAFRWLESQADAGRIRRYGVSSNTSPAPAANPEATSLDRLLAAARQAGGEENRFAVLQLPFNLLERDAALVTNSGADLGQTVLERARESGIAVLVNRPLNAMSRDGLVRLADFRAGDADVDLDEQLASLRALEEEYRKTVASGFETAEGSLEPRDFFRWGEELAALAPRLGGHPHWKQVETDHVMPRLTQLVGALDRGLSGDAQAAWRSFKERYLPAIDSALNELGRRARQRSAGDTEQLRAALAKSLPGERAGDSLSRQALWIVASTPGVSCVLVGMREPRYLDDAVAVLGWPPLDDAIGLLVRS